MTDFSDTKFEYKVDKEGRLVSIVTYPAKEIEIPAGNNKMTVGTQNAYEVLSVIEKDKVKDIYLFLVEQFKLLSNDKEKMQKRLEELKYVDEEKIAPLLTDATILEAAKKKKKLEYINDFLQKVALKIDLKSKVDLIEPNLNKYREQIDFIEKNFKKQLNL